MSDHMKGDNETQLCNTISEHQIPSKTAPRNSQSQFAPLPLGKPFRGGEPFLAAVKHNPPKR